MVPMKDKDMLLVVLISAVVMVSSISIVMFVVFGMHAHGAGYYNDMMPWPRGDGHASMMGQLYGNTTNLTYDGMPAYCNRMM